ncbi:hypothetical protein MNBD_GAMMA11-429 [hydrothermal vent metagenome]|uniref:Uncharacterized protein n=1 Tax=hydrothermal vent metagenome TaxID=652676 RepID=A0A3B0WY14_9ZZZZ
MVIFPLDTITNTQRIAYITLAISASVGKDAQNHKRDVALIQVLINIFDAWKKPIEKLKVDGLYGKNTREAIRAYQAQAVKIKPDLLIEVDGITFRYMTMYLSNFNQTKIKSAARSNRDAQKLKPIVTKKLIESQTGLEHLKVTYKSSLPKSSRIVSNYSMAVIKIALKQCGMTHAVITSTIRTPYKQAFAMYDNAHGNYQEQYDLYGHAGKKTLEVMKANLKKPKKEVVNLMVEKINELAQSSSLSKTKRRVSKHVVPKEIYLKENIIDIGVASTKEVCKNFNIKKFTKAIENLKKEGYIERYFDETKMRNNAWHIEIKVGKKPLVDDTDASILQTTRWC